MAAKIPATVITGLSGRRKTTLIRNLLARANGKRIALIVNEFGDIGVDGEVLKGCGDAACAEDDIVELSKRLHLLHRRRRFSCQPCGH